MSYVRLPLKFDTVYEPTTLESALLQSESLAYFQCAPHVYMCNEDATTSSEETKVISYFLLFHDRYGMVTSLQHMHLLLGLIALLSRRGVYRY